jgi:4-hydroxymandelate synthase
VAVHDIAHVELFTRDKVSMVDHFVSAMGFTVAAEAVEVDRSSTLLRQGDVRLVVTTGHGIWGFLHQHGDGIADIALACDDVTATYEAARSAGAGPAPSRYGVPRLKAFGDVCHTLLPRRPAGSTPPGRRWVAAGTAPTPPVERIRLLDHVAVCAEPQTTAHLAAFYQDAFGFTRLSAPTEPPVLRSASERVTLALAAPAATATPQDPLVGFLERNGGPGVQSLAFRSPDIVSGVRELRARGMEFLPAPDAHDDRLAGHFPDLAGLRDAQVLAQGAPGAYLLQAFGRSPHERGTLSYDLVQRHGSPELGAAALMARYAALERHHVAVS